VPKMVQIGPAWSVGQRGEILCAIGLFSSFFTFLAKVWRILGVSPHSLHWMTCFGGD